MLMNIEKRIFNIFEGKLKNKQGCLLKHTVRQNSILVLKFNFRKNRELDSLNPFWTRILNTKTKIMEFRTFAMKIVKIF